MSFVSGLDRNLQTLRLGLHLDRYRVCRVSGHRITAFDWRTWSRLRQKERQRFTTAMNHENRFGIREFEMFVVDLPQAFNGSYPLVIQCHKDVIGTKPAAVCLRAGLHTGYPEAMPMVSEDAS